MNLTLPKPPASPARDAAGRLNSEGTERPSVDSTRAGGDIDAATDEDDELDAKALNGARKRARCARDEVDGHGDNDSSLAELSPRRQLLASGTDVDGASATSDGDIDCCSNVDDAENRAPRRSSCWNVHDFGMVKIGPERYRLRSGSFLDAISWKCPDGDVLYQCSGCLKPTLCRRWDVLRTHSHVCPGGAAANDPRQSQPSNGMSSESPSTAAPGSEETWAPRNYGVINTEHKELPRPPLFITRTQPWIGKPGGRRAEKGCDVPNVSFYGNEKRPSWVVTKSVKYRTQRVEFPLKYYKNEFEALSAAIAYRISHTADIPVHSKFIRGLYFYASRQRWISRVYKDGERLDQFISVSRCGNSKEQAYEVCRWLHEKRLAELGAGKQPSELSTAKDAYREFKLTLYVPHRISPHPPRRRRAPQWTFTPSSTTPTSPS